MSKIGKLPIQVVEGVTIQIEGRKVTVTGPKGSLIQDVPDGISIKNEEGILTVTQNKKNDLDTRAAYGLTRALVANMVEGVSKGYERKLELVGVGYRAQVQGADLVMSLGFAHPVKITPPEGIKFLVTDNVISVSGIDKSEVGNISAKIRAVKPPEPYKGKGIKYEGERVRRKAGKAVKAAEGK